MASVNSKVKLAALGSAVALMSHVAMADDLKTVRYSKQDLNQLTKNEFVQARDLSDVLAEKIKIIAVAVTHRQGGNNVATRDVVSSGAQPSKAAWWRRLSTLAVDPDQTPSRADEEKLRTTLSQQTRKATEVKFKEAFPILEKIRNGLNVNLDLMRPSAVMAKNIPTPDIRYGLVETDILPGERSIPIAKLGSISDVDPDYSTKAKVLYTIDKVSGETTRQVFQDDGSVYGDELHLQNTGLWRKKPSTSMNLKIDAADQEATVSDKMSQGSIPGARLTVTQADGFISTKFVVGGNSDVKKSLLTEFKAPIYGEMSLSRTYDHKMNAKETSAINILGSSARPRINLTYAHVDKKARGEWIVKKSTYEYSIIAEPRQGWSPNGASKLGAVGDKISLNLNTSF